MNTKLHADNYVQTLSEEQKNSRKYGFSAKSKAELEKWQAEFRPVLKNLLGLDNIAKRANSELNPICLKKETFADHIREEWKIESEPGYQVPFYILKPLNQDKPAPLVLTPHGHGKQGKAIYVGIAEDEEARSKMIDGERDIALQAVREGYVAIAPDVRAFAETRFTKDIKEDATHSCRTMQMHALLFGRTLVGERVWDISRLIDFAETLDYVDTSTIIITGNSGGGTVSLFAGAVETRISIVMPGSYFCTFQHSIGSIRHCECNYVPEIMNHGEMWDVAGLIAPRPFLAINGKEDRIFPIKYVKESFAKVEQIYEVAGVPERCELYIGDGPHRYYKERAWPFVAEWKDKV